MLTGGPLLDGAPGPAGPGICGMVGKPEGGGGGGLLYQCERKHHQNFLFCSLGINKYLQHRPPLQAHSSQPISASAHPKQSVNQKHRALLVPQYQ